MNVLSLFDGMSCGRIALSKIGANIDTYYASEIEKNAISVSKYNWTDVVHIGSVTDVKAENLPKIDLLIGGSPCQGFSFAGKQLNFEDPRSKLFFEFVRLLKECKPKYFLLENNRMKKEYQDIISEYLGVQPIKINSKLVSAQNRSRLYWTNIPNACVPEDKNIHLSSIVGQYDGIWVYPRGFNKGGVQSYKGKSPTITISSWQHNFFVHKNGENIPFTVEQCEQLQTVPVGYTNVPNISPNARYKMLGNGWTIDVIAHLLKGIL
jgi:DNA (cytosine-5)-methyltransferase 3A